MMHGRGKSDSAIVAAKPANNAERSAAEPVEPRTETEGNADQQSTRRAQSRVSVSQALERIRQVAKERKKERFTALFHHISIDLLDEAFFELKQDAAAGVDDLTWQDYQANLERNLEDLHERVQRGAYRALPSRRTYIPKPDGRQRPLAIAALEDKIVQRATVALLNAIYEEDFLGLSYGFRPGRCAHDALDALFVGINSTKVNWILDADIRSFFDKISQQWLVRFLEHRIGDRRIIRLIQKWLKVGVLENGIVAVSDRGTGQGSVISPLLANIYLHPLDELMAARGYRMVRYADDFVVLCRSPEEAAAALATIQAWVAENGLRLHPQKTHVGDCRQAGQGFEFLGYRFEAGRRWVRKKSLNRLKDKIRERTRRAGGQSLARIIEGLNPILKGWFAYFQHAHPYTFQMLDGFIRRRLRSILLRQKTKQSCYGMSRAIHQRWPNSFFAEAGLLALHTAWLNARHSR